METDFKSKRNYNLSAYKRETPKNSKLNKMTRPRNMQMKEHGKNPQDQINEEKMGSLPEKEFRVMIVKMIQNLGNKVEHR